MKLSSITQQGIKVNITDMTSVLKSPLISACTCFAELLKSRPVRLNRGVNVASSLSEKLQTATQVERLCFSTLFQDAVMILKRSVGVQIIML